MSQLTDREHGRKVIHKENLRAFHREKKVFTFPAPWFSWLPLEAKPVSVSLCRSAAPGCFSSFILLLLGALCQLSPPPPAFSPSSCLSISPPPPPQVPSCGLKNRLQSPPWSLGSHAYSMLPVVIDGCPLSSFRAPVHLGSRSPPSRPPHFCTPLCFPCKGCESKGNPS